MRKSEQGCTRTRVWRTILFEKKACMHSARSQSHARQCDSERSQEKEAHCHHHHHHPRTTLPLLDPPSHAGQLLVHLCSQVPLLSCKAERPVRRQDRPAQVPVAVNQHASPVCFVGTSSKSRCAGACDGDHIRRERDEQGGAFPRRAARSFVQPGRQGRRHLEQRHRKQVVSMCA